MGFLAVMVGVTSVAVNRYLIAEHSKLVQGNLPVIELASRIGSQAELVPPLVTALLNAQDAQEIARINASLLAALTSIESGLARLGVATPAASSAAQTSERLARNLTRALALGQRIRAQGADLAASGENLDAIVEAGMDLARLRITAGIAGLHAAPLQDGRRALDDLADRHFFAFERLTELSRALDRLRLNLQSLVNLHEAAALPPLHEALARDLALVKRRLAFLPTAEGREAAARLVGLLDSFGAGDGLITLAGQRIALRQAAARDRLQLTETVTALSSAAKRAQRAVQSAGIARIARTDRMAAWISAGLLALALFALVLSLVLWLYARKQLVQRLANLSRRIIGVARNDFGSPLAISGRDEIGRLEKAVNVLRRRMTQAEALRADLEAAVIARTGDVVEQMRAADDARAAAEAANRHKTEFLARMTHEIRTPLNGLIGMLHLLEAEMQNPDRRARARIAHQSACELRDLADDILDFAGTEVATARNNPVHFVLRDLVGQLGQQLLGLARDKGLAAEIDIAKGVPAVLYGDRVKIRQIVGNLISNAVKYTHAGRVALSVDHAPDPASGQSVLGFAVTDTGIGMSQQTIERAFDAYSRGEGARRDGIAGVGLGLAISRSLTEALGGAIRVESQPGAGSRFTLTVPLWPGDAAQVQEPFQDAPQGRAGARVLVIDDHAVNRMVARGYLARLGCDVTEAASGRDAIGAYAPGAFDLVLLDLDLPDLPGQEVAARLRQIDPDVRIAALTAHRIKDDAANRARLNVQRILSKPVSPRALAGIVAAPVAAPAAQSGPAPTRTPETILREDIADLGAQTARQIVEAFLSDLPAAIAAIETGSGAARGKAAHRLKGAAANFGLTGLCAVLGDLQAGQGGSEAGADLRAEAERAARDLRAAAHRTGLFQPASGSTK